MSTGLLESIGGETGCQRIAAAFYARVGKDPVLRRLFPGKTLRCATEEFAAFLIQFLGGDEEHTEKRWWLSLRESHARFRISAVERSAWLRHMRATLEAATIDEKTRAALHHFFLNSSAYVTGKHGGEPEHEELGRRWREQLVLDELMEAISQGRDAEAMTAAPLFISRPSVFVGVLARMVRSRRPALVEFVLEMLEKHPWLVTRRFSGRTLLHFASGAGCIEVVAMLLRLGADPDVADRGDHTPLYSVANECGSEAGPEVVRALVKAGADVNVQGGVTRATPLHMAARRGFVEIGAALLECGAAVNLRDAKGVTPLQRAMNCRREGMVRLLRIARAPA